MEEETNEYSQAVQCVVVAVYHHWMTASPSKYPPNLHTRVQSRDGCVYKRDFMPLVGIGINEYRKFKACDAKYVKSIWEFTPNGKALKIRMVLKMEMRDVSTTHWSFGSCNACWKKGKRNFTDSTMTGHPLRLPCDDPSLPRLGRCGCVVCNECVRELEMNIHNKERMDVHCPYCGNEECFSKHMRIWLVSDEINNHNRDSTLSE